MLSDYKLSTNDIFERSVCEVRIPLSPEYCYAEGTDVSKCMLSKVYDKLPSYVSVTVLS